jgi:hypothetical protein
MSIPGARTQVLDYFGTPLATEPIPSRFSGAAGLLLIRRYEPCIGQFRAFPEALDDPRDPDLTEQTFVERVRARVDDRKGVEDRLQIYPLDPFR